MGESMTPFYALAIAGAAIIICLLYKCSSLNNRCLELSEQISKNEFVRFVDTGGISQNPPVYIDLWEGKTINFRLGEWDIKIPQMRPEWCFKYLRKFAGSYKVMLEQAENKDDTKLEDFVYGAAYAVVVQSIYDLSKHFVKDRKKYRDALIARSRKDIMFILEISEQLFDFWTYTKKKIALLSAQTTLRRTAGANFADGSCRLDIDGKIYAIPRFESGLNTVQ